MAAKQGFRPLSSLDSCPRPLKSYVTERSVGAMLLHHSLPAAVPHPMVGQAGAPNLKNDLDAVPEV
jgi:hypothetical protein